MAFRERNESNQGPAGEQEMQVVLRTSRDQGGPQSLLHFLLQKADDLVGFIVQKYSNKEMTPRAEILHTVLKDCQEYFALIFRIASDCLYMVFGIDVQEINPPGHIYYFEPLLGLTYNRRVGDNHNAAKTGLLILIITLIFKRGNRASERIVWLALSRMQVYDGIEHWVYGDPRKFITEDLVQEGYLVYRQVPNRNPARYVFLWGPRTHAETTKMRVLEHLAKVHGREPWCYPRLYEEALREQRENGRLRRLGH